MWQNLQLLFLWACSNNNKKKQTVKADLLPFFNIRHIHTHFSHAHTHFSSNFISLLCRSNIYLCSSSDHNPDDGSSQNSGAVRMEKQPTECLFSKKEYKISRAFWTNSQLLCSHSGHNKCSSQSSPNRRLAQSVHAGVQFVHSSDPGQLIFS